MKSYLLIFMLCISAVLQAQYYDKSIKKTDISLLQSALNTLEKNNYIESDLDSWIIQSDASSRNSNAWYYYVVQTYNNIIVRNTVANVLVLNGQAQVTNSRFIKNLASKINIKSPLITPQQAVNFALEYHGLEQTNPKQISFNKEKSIIVFKKTNELYSDIKVNLVYEKISEGKVVLAYNVNLDYKQGSHWWNTRIDAQSGAFINSNDWVTSCSWGDNKNHINHNHKAKIKPKAINFSTLLFKNENLNTASSTMVSAYRVLPYYVESPNHGNFELITNPDDAEASSLGWHNDGINSYNSTRGNNVIARYDASGNNSSLNSLSNQSSNGLVFDYSYGGTSVSARTYIDASRVQLFYMNNVVHDIYYKYGFDEASGNFQESNINFGFGFGDPVDADAQDGSRFNNADFSTPEDGISGRMQMYLWNQGAYNPNRNLLLTINNSFLAGNYTALDNNFSPGNVPVTSAITGDLVLVEDDNTGGNLSTNVNDGCGIITNSEKINGNIAVVIRGSCNFTVKVIEAQNAGAIAVLVINNVAGDVNMSGSDNAISIPTYSLNKADGDAIISQMSTETINATFNVPSSDPPFVELDGDFDNGVVAHEYGHGINIRLVAGRFNSSCVNAVESMGEGWADYIGKIIQLKNINNGITLNGVGTFVVGQSPDGIGIRPAPYSGSIENNPMTYQLLKRDINNNIFTIPHGVGSVWAGMLMDMTWDLIAVYGFTEDIYDSKGTFGNTVALNLVVEAMKLTACNPGFVDGRDALLKADDVLYGNGVAGSGTGVNQCIIWSAFARRGLGVSANQGATNSTSDGDFAYDLPTACAPNYLIDNGDDEIEDICQGTTSASYEFVFYEQNGYDVETAFEAVGLPAGVNVSFSPQTMKDTGLFTMTLNDIPSNVSGNYQITVIPGGDANKSKDVTLKINPPNPNILDGDTKFSINGGTFNSFLNNETINTVPGVDLDLQLPNTAFDGSLVWTGPDGTTYNTNTVSFENILDGDNKVEGNWTLDITFTNDCAVSFAPQNMNFAISIDPLLSVGNFSLQQLVLYPNPTKSSVIIKGIPFVKNTKINITDITGRVLLNKVEIVKTSEAITINMSRLASGAYFISINNNKLNIVKKVVKQ